MWKQLTWWEYVKHCWRKRTRKSCSICGGACVEYSVTDELWDFVIKPNRLTVGGIIPDGGERSVCMDCFARLCHSTFRTYITNRNFWKSGEIISPAKEIHWVDYILTMKTEYIERAGKTPTHLHINTADYQILLNWLSANNSTTSMKVVEKDRATQCAKVCGLLVVLNESARRPLILDHA